MRSPSLAPLIDRTGTRLRTAGLGALLALAVAAAVIPETPPAQAAGESPEPQGLRRSDDFRRRFPDYPGALFTPMGRLEMNGNPAEMHTFRSSDSLEQVVNYYGRVFRRSGRHVSVDGGGDAAMVSYYDETTGELVAVHAIRQGSGTLAFPSIMDVTDGIHIAPEYPERLPMIEGAVTVSRLDDQNTSESATSSSISQIISGTTVEVSARFEKAMIDRGYRAMGSSKGAFVGAGERVTVSYTPINKKDRPETAVFILLEKTP